MPKWLLVPGATVFLVSTTAFLSLVHVIGLGGYDLSVYLVGGEAFRHGAPVYDQVIHSAYGDGYFTYPPVTLLFFGPLSLLPHWAVQTLMLIVALTALLAAIWLSGRLLGYQQGAGLVGATLGIAGAALWLQPVYDSLDQGQINLMLMAMILADFALARSRRWPTGILIGAATAIKITPGIFILFLLLGRRYRPALTAAGTWLALTLVGLLLAHRESVHFWIDGTFADSKRVASPLPISDGSNQSLNGVAHRLLDNDGAATAVWTVLALATLVLGMWLAVELQRKGLVLPSVLACAVTGLLVSPLTWHEHWVWIVPILICLGEFARRVYPYAPSLAPALPCVAAVPFLMWPQSIGDAGQVGPASILSTAASRWNGGHHDPLVALAGAAYVVVGLCLLVGAAYLLRHVQTPKHSPAAEARDPAA